MIVRFPRPITSRRGKLQEQASKSRASQSPPSRALSPLNQPRLRDRGGQLVDGRGLMRVVLPPVHGIPLRNEQRRKS